MKTLSLLSLSLLFGLGALEAQQFPRDQFGRGPGRGGFMPSVGFNALDANGDGVLSGEELVGAGASLKKLDTNGDGKITEDEIRAAMPQGFGRGGPEGRRREGGREEGPRGASADDTVQTLMALDRNGDGKISKDELPERMQGMLERGDENKDGVLNADEVRKLAASQAPSAGQAGRGGRGPEGAEFAMMRMDRVLAAVDSDADGTISSEEIRNSSAALRKLDQDSDGRITQEEARPAMGGRRGRFE